MKGIEMTPESELETIIQWHCYQSFIGIITDEDVLTAYEHGKLYWFNIEQSVPGNYFALVVNDKDEPITKLVRKS